MAPKRRRVPSFADEADEGLTAVQHISIVCGVLLCVVVSEYYTRSELRQALDEAVLSPDEWGGVPGPWGGYIKWRNRCASALEVLALHYRDSWSRAVRPLALLLAMLGMAYQDRVVPFLSSLSLFTTDGIVGTGPDADREDTELLDLPELDPPPVDSGASYHESEATVFTDTFGVIPKEVHDLWREEELYAKRRQYRRTQQMKHRRLPPVRSREQLNQLDGAAASPRGGP